MKPKLNDVWEVTIKKEVTITDPVTETSLPWASIAINETPKKDVRLIYREEMLKSEMEPEMWVKLRNGDIHKWGIIAQEYYGSNLLAKGGNNRFDIIAVGYEKDKWFWGRKEDMVLAKVPREEAERNGWEVLDETRI